MRTNGLRNGILVSALALAPLAASAQEGSKAVDAAWEKAIKANDLEAIVGGALDQRRLLVGSPKRVGATELEALLRASL